MSRTPFHTFSHSYSSFNTPPFLFKATERHFVSFSIIIFFILLLFYKQVIRPVWIYGVQLWGCASDSNIQVILRYQNKALKCIVNAPWRPSS
jgi:hypothetical protein